VKVDLLVGSMRWRTSSLLLLLIPRVLRVHVGEGQGKALLV